MSSARQEAIRSIVETKHKLDYIDFKKDFVDNPALIAATTPNSLPSSFAVKLKDPHQFSIVSSAVSQAPGVQTVAITLGSLWLDVRRDRARHRPELHEPEPAPGRSEARPPPARPPPSVAYAREPVSPPGALTRDRNGRSAPFPGLRAIRPPSVVGRSRSDHTGVMAAGGG